MILVRGAGELASGVAHRLHQSHFRVCLTETARPVAIRRGVAFSEAVYDGEKEVEGVVAQLVDRNQDIAIAWQRGRISLLVDPDAGIRLSLKPDVLVDATIAKNNLGTKKSDASLVIGCGPGFEAGEDVHCVIETNRGPDLGRVIMKGGAEADTGVPGELEGYTVERILRSPESGTLITMKQIGETVRESQTIASVNGTPVKTRIDGVIRGLLRSNSIVHQHMKIGDVDPRGVPEYCYLISDKSRAVARGVLEAIQSHFHV